MPAVVNYFDVRNRNVLKILHKDNSITMPVKQAQENALKEIFGLFCGFLKLEIDNRVAYKWLIHKTNEIRGCKTIEEVNRCKSVNYGDILNNSISDPIEGYIVLTLASRTGKLTDFAENKRKELMSLVYKN